MKLRNKKTGEITEANDWNIISEYKTLADLTEEWEDYEEPKDFWFIDDFTIMCGGECEYASSELATFTKKGIEKLREIGNHFEIAEEAERAVEKLKAWKRLKDKGFRFTGWATNEGIRCIDFEVPDTFFSEDKHSRISDETMADLDLLFGGEE